MEITILHPLVLWIGIPAVLAVAFACFFIKKGGTAFRGGLRASNTNLIKQTKTYRIAVRQHRFLSGGMLVCFLAASVSMLVMMSRPVSRERVEIGQRRRDIFLCMDTDIYLDDLNGRVIEELITFVEGLEGDRVGILLFNSSSYLYVPMTDDYNYVVKKLREVQEFFRVVVKIDQEYYLPYPGCPYDLPSDVAEAYEEDFARYEVLHDRVYTPSMSHRERGFCMVGDGLYSCMYTFPRFGAEDRSRVVLLSTANIEFEGNRPQVTLEQAAQACAENNVTVFSLYRGEEAFEDTHGASQRFLYDVEMADDTSYESARAGMEMVARVTGGRFYEYGVTMSVEDILKEIFSQEALQVGQLVQDRQIDHPKIPFAVLFVSMIGMCVIAIRLKVS